MISIGYYRRIEATSLLELSLCKKKMDEMKNKEESDRDACGCKCGSDVVIENVILYLWTNAFYCVVNLSVDLYRMMLKMNGQIGIMMMTMTTAQLLLIDLSLADKKFVSSFRNWL